MTILRTDKIAGLESVNAITGSVFFGNGNQTSNVKTNNVLITEKSSDFTFGTGDFTIEGWFYTPDLTNWNLLVGDDVYQSTGGWSLYFNTDPDIDWWKGASSVVSGATPTVNTWHHVAFSRESGTNRVFLDGALGASASDSTDYTGTQILIGANQLIASTSVSQWGFKGYVSNVRVIKGKSIYGGAFTPPTRELEVTPETVLLCCQSSANILQEATGKTLYTLNTPVASTFTPDVGNDHTHGTVLEGNAEFPSLNYMTLPRGTTTQSNRGRGVFGGGYYEPGAGSANLKSIEYFNIQSTGNAIDFGDRTIVGHGLATVSSSTRGVMMGGRAYHYPSAPSSPQTNIIDYVTIATTSNATDFGDMVDGDSYIFAAASNATRGIISKGGSNAMSYITIASLGNSVDTGGDSTIARNTFTGFASPTRAIFAGGGTPSAINNIDYVTIASLGDAINFGDLTFTGHCQGASSETRGIIFTGGFPSAASNVIDFITIASTGDAQDFGDFHANITSHSAGSGISNSIRAVRCGGYVAPAKTNRMDYVTITTTGNSSDFGDLIVARYSASGFSDSHGGLI